MGQQHSDPPDLRAAMAGLGHAVEGPADEIVGPTGQPNIRKDSGLRGRCTEQGHGNRATGDKFSQIGFRFHS